VSRFILYENGKGGMMKALELIREFKKRLSEDTYSYDYNRETNKLRLTHKDLERGIEISVPPILAKYET